MPKKITTTKPKASNVNTTEEADGHVRNRKGGKAFEKDGFIRIRLAIGVFQYAASYAVSASTAANSLTKYGNYADIPIEDFEIMMGVNTLDCLIEFLFNIKKDTKFYNTINQDAEIFFVTSSDIVSITNANRSKIDKVLESRPKMAFMLKTDANGGIIADSGHRGLKKGSLLDDVTFADLCIDMKELCFAFGIPSEFGRDISKLDQGNAGTGVQFSAKQDAMSIEGVKKSAINTLWLQTKQSVASGTKNFLTDAITGFKDCGDTNAKYAKIDEIREIVAKRLTHHPPDMKAADYIVEIKKAVRELNPEDLPKPL